MKELLNYIVCNIVENRDAVEVHEEENNESITLYLTVSKEDMGKVIGRKGKIANSLRTIVRACNNESGKNVFVEIVD